MMGDCLHCGEACDLVSLLHADDEEEEMLMIDCPEEDDDGDRLMVESMSDGIWLLF